MLKIKICLLISVNYLPVVVTMLYGYPNDPII